MVDYALTTFFNTGSLVWLKEYMYGVWVLDPKFHPNNFILCGQYPCPFSYGIGRVVCGVKQQPGGFWCLSCPALLVTIGVLGIHRYGTLVFWRSNVVYTVVWRGIEGYALVEIKRHRRWNGSRRQIYRLFHAVNCDGHDNSLEIQHKRGTGSELLRFVSISGATGCIWYLRNWFWMGNPFYPFIFGGRYWDQFRADLLAGVGTGSGRDLKAIISLPLTVTLGYQDINGFDGDVGPLLLLMLPITLWVAIRFTRFELRQKRTLSTLMLFSGVGAGFWVYGYITAKGLWQTRLLFPAIIPSIMLAGFSMSLIQELDTKKLRVSFIVSSLVIASVFINLFDLGLSTTVRNPLATATGIVSREDYMQKFQPEFTSAIRSI